MQPQLDFSDIQKNPKSINIRTGVFWLELEQMYEVYMMENNEQIFSKHFDILSQALAFLNSSNIIFRNKKFTLS
jgi:hypothetical protein